MRLVEAMGLSEAEHRSQVLVKGDIIQLLQAPTSMPNMIGRFEVLRLGKSSVEEGVVVVEDRLAIIADRSHYEKVKLYGKNVEQLGPVKIINRIVRIGKVDAGENSWSPKRNGRGRDAVEEIELCEFISGHRVAFETYVAYSAAAVDFDDVQLETK